MIGQEQNLRRRLIFVLTLHVRKTGREKQGENARITLLFLPFKPAGLLRLRIDEVICG